MYCPFGIISNIAYKKLMFLFSINRLYTYMKGRKTDAKN